MEEEILHTHRVHRCLHSHRYVSHTCSLTSLPNTHICNQHQIPQCMYHRSYKAEMHIQIVPGCTLSPDTPSLQQRSYTLTSKGADTVMQTNFDVFFGQISTKFRPNFDSNIP